MKKDITVDFVERMQNSTVG